MIYTKEKTLTQINAQEVVKFLSMASIAVLLPFFIHVQWLTGPIINAILILVLFLSGIRGALVVCMIPSMIALAGGLLPAILSPVVPFIMVSNAILILTIDWFYNKSKSLAKGYWIGVLAGSGLKFLFLFFSVNFISRLLIKQELAIKVAQMMSWPQFATAFIGGMIAWIILRFLKRI